MTEINPYKMMRDAKSMLVSVIDVLNCVADSDKVCPEIADKIIRISSALEIDVEELRRLKKKIKVRD